MPCYICGNPDTQEYRDYLAGLLCESEESCDRCLSGYRFFYGAEEKGTLGIDGDLRDEAARISVDHVKNWSTIPDWLKLDIAIEAGCPVIEDALREKIRRTETRLPEETTVYPSRGGDQESLVRV